MAKLKKNFTSYLKSKVPNKFKEIFSKCKW